MLAPSSQSRPYSEHVLGKQEMRQLFSVDDAGLTKSVTQQQLHDLHAAQRDASAKVLDHLDGLATLTGFAGTLVCHEG